MDNITLHNLVASGNYTFAHPIEAYKSFHDTYDTKWLNTSIYRYQVDSTGWFVNEPVMNFIDYFFFVLLVSDPTIDDRMHSNNSTMEMSFSILHLSDFNASNTGDVSFAAQENFILSGPVGKAELSRADCNFTRNFQSGAAEDAVPWLWTNDTSAITTAYKDFWGSFIGEYAPKGIAVPTPTPKDIIWLYQAYIISVNTVYSFTTPQMLSVWKDTVQIATGVLLILVVVFIVIIPSTARYFAFLYRHKGLLDKIYIPDSKLEWMVHGAMLVEEQQGAANSGSHMRRDSELFRCSTFGCYISSFDEAGSGKLPRPMLPRIRTPSVAKQLDLPHEVSNTSSSGTIVMPMPIHVSEPRDPDASTCSVMSLGEKTPSIVPKTQDSVHSCPTLIPSSYRDSSEAPRSTASSISNQGRLSANHDEKRKDEDSRSHFEPQSPTLEVHPKRLRE